MRFEKDSKNKDNKRDNRRKRDKIYIVNSNTSEYQYLSSFSKDRLYIGIGDEDESINYAYNEPFYILIFNYRNAVFNTEKDKFNAYRLSLTKIPILDIYIFKLDLSRATYSGIEISLNKIIQILNIRSKV